jgi:hypothetical protein
VGRVKEKRLCGKPRHRYMCDIKMDLEEIGLKVWPECIIIGTTDGLL